MMHAPVTSHLFTHINGLHSFHDLPAPENGMKIDSLYDLHNWRFRELHFRSTLLLKTTSSVVLNKLLKTYLFPLTGETDAEYLMRKILLYS